MGKIPPHLPRRRLLLQAVLAWSGGMHGLAWAEGGAGRPPALLLARVLPPGTEPAHYLVSEKYDGVRAYWDGRQLRFRSGRVVQAPAWFISRLPTRALDGELWLGRGRFEAL